MADLIDMLIEVLRIDCNVVNCYYTNQIDAIFNLFFFPTVFILLIIYLLLQYILDEVKGGLRLLIAIALYAVIVLNGLMTLFIPLSQFWWIVLLIIFGAWVFFFRLLFKEKKGGGKLAGAMAGGVSGYLTGRTKRAISGKEKEEIENIEDDLGVLRKMTRDAKNSPDPERLKLGCLQFRDAIKHKIQAVEETGYLSGFINVEHGKVDHLKKELKECDDELKKTFK